MENELRHAVGGHDVVCLGHATVDRIYSVEAIPSIPTKLGARGYREVGGGMAANAACAIARLGGRVAFWGRAGDDQAGRFMVDDFLRWGVEIAGFRLVPGAKSSQSAVLADTRGERLVVNFRGELPDCVDRLPLAEVARARCVLADLRWWQGALALFRAARGHGVPAVLDADVAEREITDRLLPFADHVVFSEDGLRAWSATDDIAQALERALAAMVAASATPGRHDGGPVVGVTRGAAGSTWRTPLRRLAASAPRVRAVDTLGAGDVFHGAYALAIAEGRDLERAIAFASAAAAVKCSRSGGREGAPSREEVERLMSSPDD